VMQPRQRANYLRALKNLPTRITRLRVQERSRAG
jgi:hypothetical protein